MHAPPTYIGMIEYGMFLCLPNSILFLVSPFRNNPYLVVSGDPSEHRSPDPGKLPCLKPPSRALRRGEALPGAGYCPRDVHRGSLKASGVGVPNLMPVLATFRRLRRRWDGEVECVGDQAP